MMVFFQQSQLGKSYLSKAFLKMGQPQPLLSFILRLFKQTTLQFLQQIYVKFSIHYTVPGYDPTIFGHESPLITTEPRLPPILE